MPGTNQQSTNYLSIIGGKIRQSASEQDLCQPNVEKREYEVNGEKKTKIERVFKAWNAKVVDIYNEQTDYGDMLVVELEDATMRLSWNSRYPQVFLRKIKNADLSKEINISPFDFVSDEGKKIVGMNIFQDGQKLQDYYFDPETKTGINGMPEPEGDTTKFDNDDWKMFFIKVKKFLGGTIEDIRATIPQENKKEETNKDDQPEDVSVEDVPF